MDRRKITKATLSVIFFIAVAIISNACIKSHKRMSKRIKGISNDTKTIINILTANNDITKYPKAKGDLRLAQRTSIAVLKRFDEIAKRHNITYWLDWGTLLGAVRHGGFIPWDDDIDIAMEREEYERVIPILESEFNGDGFFIKVWGITQLFYKDTPAHFDIFPFDKGYSVDLPSGEDYNKFSKNLKYLIEKKLKNKNMSIKEHRYSLYKERDSILFNNRKSIDNGFLFYGIGTSCCGVEPNLLLKYSDIFPLKKISFEGMEFYVPNNTEYYLHSLFGDYMSYPNELMPHHDLVDILKNGSSYKNSLELVKMYNVRE